MGDVDAGRCGRVAELVTISKKAGVAKLSFMAVALKQQSEPSARHGWMARARAPGARKFSIITPR